MMRRRKTNNRKQMSDLDVLDTYKQGTVALGREEEKRLERLR